MRKSKRKNIHEGEKGVIMMETLIMLPVYLLILAGIFWLGELCLIRQKLTAAERLRLWESGIRHTDQEIPFRSVFYRFPEGTGTRSGVTSGVDGLTNMQTKDTEGFGDKPTNSLAWGTEKTGFVQLNALRSARSWGIVQFIIGGLWSFSGVFSEERQVLAGRDVMLIRSRTDGMGEPLPSTVFFRRERDNGIRAGDTPYVDKSKELRSPPLWDSIYLEKWSIFPDGIPPTVTSGDKRASGLSEYGARHANFVTWSDVLYNGTDITE